MTDERHCHSESCTEFISVLSQNLPNGLEKKRGNNETILCLYNVEQIKDTIYRRYRQFNPKSL